MSFITVTGILTNPSGTVLSGYNILFEAIRTSDTVVNNTSVTVVTDSNGAYNFELGYGTYTLKIKSGREARYSTVASNILIYSQVLDNKNIQQILLAQADIEDVNEDLITRLFQIKSETITASITATAAANTATTKAAEALSSATSAANSTSIATTKATEAANSATSAANSASTATTKAAAASTSAAEALVSEQNAATSEANALASANTASTAANTATVKASEAATSATSAATSASTATTKATAATTSETNAASSASSALASKNAAATSETSALASKNAAATSETNAASSASSALASKNAAATSETNAAASAASASTSETSALASKNAAATSETNAASSASSALASKNAATISATNAATSEANALASSNTATAKATEAAASAANASTSEANAATSEANALASANTATTKALEAASSAANALASEQAAAQYASSTISGGIVENGNVDLSSGIAPTPISNGLGGYVSTLWKVTVAGTINAIDYAVGDSIVYSKTMDSYYKIGSTGQVTSVNGMSGAVTITTISGNSGTATKLETSRSISATGDATWTVNFDGSVNTSAALTLANTGVIAGTYKSVTVDSKGRVTSAANPTTLSEFGITDAQPLDSDLTAIAGLASNGIIVRTATGAATTRSIAVSGNGVSITNADGVVGNPSITIDSASTNAASTLVFRDTKGDFSANTITANLSGNATTASSLQTARTISISSDATGSVSFNGSQNVDIALTLANTGVTAGTYKSVTVDAKGRVTGATNPTTLSGFGITDAQPLDAELTAFAGLSTNGIVVKTAAGTATTRSVAVTGTGLSITNADGVTGNPTITSNATNLNTVSTIVARDASGNFSAGIITAALSGNASTATKLATARSISLTGDVTGTVSFDGSADASITATIAANSVALGTDTTGNYVADVTAGSYITKTGTAGGGWSPTIAVDATSANTASKVVARDASGNFSAGTITAALAGNASTATTLQTARTIGISGDGTGTATSFNGSANITVPFTLATTGVTAGTYSSVTVDAKGRVTAGTNPIITSVGTLTSGVWSAGGISAPYVFEDKIALAASAIDVSTGGYFTKTISTATTFTVTGVPAAGNGVSFILDLTNAGAYTITWWSGVKWSDGGTAPVLTASGRDTLAFFTHDGGTTWTGIILGLDIK